MKSVQVKITNPSYLHANMVKKITEVAGPFTCDIYVINGTNKANAKSLISLMSVLGSLKLPAKVEIRAEGWTDEAEAVEAVVKVFNK